MIIKMKKQSLLSLLVVAIMAVFTTVSCDNNGSTTVSDEDNVSAGGKTLFGDYSSDVTLKANTEYKLKGEAIFKNGATLFIEEGVTLIADPSVISYILIEQGAKIDAEGTATSPIIMTSSTQEAGAWGGLHLCGKAPINTTSGTGDSEIGGAVYGGTSANDNSGTIKYVRLEYTGVSLDPEHESNGISFYGVGSGTTVEYVQVYEGADDGYEFFGGTVNLKHALSTHSQDDSFDWTEGWSGMGQYWIAEQGSIGDRGIEGDNNGNNNEATPFASPTLSQVTLLGAGNDGNYGMKLREGTKGKFVNLIVTGFDKRSIHVEHNQTLKNVGDNSLDVDYAYVSSDVSDAAIKYSVSKIDSVDAQGNVVTDGSGAIIEIDDSSVEAQQAKSDAKANGFELSDNVTVETITADASTTFTGGIDASTLNAFFTSDHKIGAGNDWTSGWTR